MKEALTFVDRRGTDCVKWDALDKMFSATDLDAFWIADMDIRVPRCVEQSLQEWVATGVYGYPRIPDEYYQSYIDWQRTRHGHTVTRDSLRFAPGIVAAVYWLVAAFSAPGDRVVVQTPVYYPFFGAVRDTGRELVCAPLLNDGGVYSVDFAALEQVFATERPRLFILCTPHNPVGRVWTEDELRTLCDLCAKYDVLLLSDEIHQDLIMDGHRHIPTAKIGTCPVITVASASKTFNLAGLRNSFVVLPTEQMQQTFDRFMSTLHIDMGATPGYVATTAAYRGGAPWLNSLCTHIEESAAAFCAILRERLPRAVVSPLEGTYLLWVDLRAYLTPERVKDVIEGQCKLAVDYGDWFGGEEYACFLRFNLATDRAMIEAAAHKLADALANE